MDSSNEINSEKGEKSMANNNKSYLKKIKSEFFLEKLLFSLSKSKLLNIIKYNKQTQNILDININDYKKYCEIYSPIEIEIIPVKNKFGDFINISKNNGKYYHIYFNDERKEVKRNYLKQGDKVTKIKVIIDYQMSISGLFKDCKCIESIRFLKFLRNNINKMSFAFSGCSSLKELNLFNFKTDNVTNMLSMFAGCSSLKQLNLSSFNTTKVKDMSKLFSGCSSLKVLNLSSFNTSKVKDMSNIFSGCSSLEKLNLSGFNISKDTNISYAFSGCSSLKELKLSKNLEHYKNIINQKGISF